MTSLSSPFPYQQIDFLQAKDFDLLIWSGRKWTSVSKGRRGDGGAETDLFRGCIQQWVQDGGNWQICKTQLWKNIVSGCVQRLDVNKWALCLLLVIKGWIFVKWVDFSMSAWKFLYIQFLSWNLETWVHLLTSFLSACSLFGHVQELSSVIFTSSRSYWRKFQCAGWTAKSLCFYSWFLTERLGITTVPSSLVSSLFQWATALMLIQLQLLKEEEDLLGSFSRGEVSNTLNVDYPYLSKKQLMIYHTQSFVIVYGLETLQLNQLGHLYWAVDEQQHS